MAPTWPSRTTISAIGDYQSVAVCLNLLPFNVALSPKGELLPLHTADAGDHSAAQLKQVAEGYLHTDLPDNGARRRDEHDQGQAAHQATPAPLYDNLPQATPPLRCTPNDCRVDPAGKTLDGVPCPRR